MPNTPRVLLLCGLAAAAATLAGCARAMMGLATATMGSSAAKVGGEVRASDLPSFDEPDLKEAQARFIADKKAWDANLDGFFPPIDGDVSCDLSAGRAEELVLGMPREKFAKILETAGGMKGRISAISWRVVSGACPDGLLEGRVKFRADYTTRATGANGFQSTTTSTSFTDGVFAKGQPDGAQTRLSMETNTALVNGSEYKSETRTFVYQTLRGKEVVGKSVTLRLMPDLPVGIQTVVKEAIEPGLYRTQIYNGPEYLSLSYEQDSLKHGEERMFARPNVPETRSCYNAGVRVAVEACDGYKVNLALAVPVDPMGKPIPGATAPVATAASAAPRPAAAAPRAPAPAPVAANPTAAPVAATPWPDLPASMTAIGGGEKDVAVIVGVENYAFVAKVAGAAKNARDWYRYFTRVRGTSPGKVRLLLDNDATDVGLRTAVEEAAKLTSDGGTLWFVFIGHGAPSADQQDGLLVGVDAQQSAQGLYGRSVPQKELLKLASAGKQKQAVFVVDACFSGRTGDGQALASGLQPLIALKAAKAPQPNTLVFTAGRADQFAGPLPRLDRPAFSYLMLGGLMGWSDANADGQISANELVDYSNDTLRAVLNGRNQTPELYPRADVALAKSAGVPGPDVAGIAVGD